MKTIPIEIPDGKHAEWINGVLTLVDERDITERIKTFDDACQWCRGMSEFTSLFVAIIMAVMFAIFSFGNATAFQNMMLIMILISVINIRYRKKGGEE